MAIAIVATAFGGPEALSVVERDVPEPQSGEVTIQVKAIGVNPYDYKLYSGAFGNNPASLPIRLGSELAGIVTATGPEAVGPAGPIQVGDEVIAYQASGTYASELTVSASKVVPKPIRLSWAQAGGLLSTGSTAVHALAATDVKAGDVVLIHGAAGGVGIAASQLAIARGATVIGTASQRRHEILRRYGVIPVSYGSGLADRVRELAPSGVDAAIDTVGTDEAVDVSVELVADRSRIASIAAFQRGGQAGIKLLGGGPGADPGTKLRANAWAELTRLAEEGTVDVPIAETFPLTQAAAAHRLIATGHAGGKVILIP